jgi:hypothetical protein
MAALQGRILELVDVDMATGGEYVTDCYMFTKKFTVAGLDAETIHTMILKQVAGQEQAFINAGLTQEEAMARIEELITIESQPLPEPVAEPVKEAE